MSAQYVMKAQINSTHAAQIHDTQFDFYGTRLASCSSDGSVNIYDMKANGKIVGTFKVYEIYSITSGDSPLWSLSWAHPRFGSIIAVSSFDGVVSIWKEVKASDWQLVVQHDHHQGSVNCVSWCPEEHGLKLASCGSDGIYQSLFQKGQVLIYARNPKLDTFAIEAHFNAHDAGVNAVSWCPEVEGQNLYLATASQDRTVIVWEKGELDDGTYHAKAKLEGHKENVRDVQWHPQGHLLASGSEDGVVIIWQFQNGNYAIQQQLNFNFNVWRVNFSPIVGNQLTVSGVHGSDTFIKLLEEDDDGLYQLVEDLDQQK